MIRTYVYVFGVDGGYAKVGKTTDIAKRGYHLCWGNLPPYVTWPVHAGVFMAVVECKDAATAARIERACQDRLNPWRHRPKARGGQCEWFNVDPSNAAEVLLEAGDEFGALPIHSYSNNPRL